MHSLLLFSPLLVVASAIALAAPPALEARAATPSCNRDNLLRCLVATPGPASAYCSSVMSQSAITTTVATVTPTTSQFNTRTSTSTKDVTSSATGTTSTTTVVLTTQTFQSSTTATATVTVFVTATATASTTAIVATTTVQPPVLKIRRADVQHLPIALRAAASPKCVDSYPMSRISSACSCLGVTRSTVRVTATASQRTVTTTQSVGATATSTNTKTVTVTVTVVNTNTISTTQISTSSFTISSSITTIGNTVTTTIPSTTTTTAAPSVCVANAPACASPTLTGNGGVQFVKTFVSCGFRNVNDPSYAANVAYNPGTTFCFAVQDCANSATSFSSDYAPNGGFSYDIYQTSDGNIECNIFPDVNSCSPADFTSPDPSVSLALAYTRVS